MYHDVPKAPHHWTMKYPRFLHVPHCSTAWCCILNGGAVGHYRIRTSSGWILDHENTYSSFQQSHTPSIIHTHWKTQWIFNETVHSSSMRLKAPTRKVIVSAVASPSASGSFTKPPATTSTKASPRMWKRMGEQFWCWKQQHFSKGSKVWFNIIVYQLSSFWETLHISLLNTRDAVFPIDFVHQGAMRDMNPTYRTHQHTWVSCLGWKVKGIDAKKNTPLFRILTFSNFNLLFDRFEVFWRINIDSKK